MRPVGRKCPGFLVATAWSRCDKSTYGLYNPHYDFDTPEAYKRELEAVRDRKKQMVRNGHATHAPMNWTVGGSKRDGERIAKQLTKLMLRAFNGECDAAVANVAWNNAPRMEQRIEKAFEVVNALGTVVQVSIERQYLNLALAELRLEHELEEKKREAAEEQRRIREQMREEERALREIQKAQDDADEEEIRFARALERARAEAERASGDKVASARARVAELEHLLAEAHAKGERAKSMAEQTRSGFVYVISNVGSFGDGLYKIGMTRRLEPLERVKELGDASVPFEFDVHGMFYTDDAPKLENLLHKEFHARRANLVNLRKEFFRVDLGELQHFLLGKGYAIELTRLAEAREYRRTLAIHESAAALPPPPAATVFPTEISL
ncbi:MAG: DUF4041 domain-containing protein [Deltaproteobacteria bacterium]|nr:DUF4041 domain-containing protein [Deltaproteobacteria bacterium]